MKRKLLLPLCAAVAACMAALLLRLIPISEPEAPAETAASSALQSVAQPAGSRWRVGVWQGHVAVYSASESIPRQVLDTELVSLPEADRQALEAGIPVDTAEALASLLEDYDS